MTTPFVQPASCSDIFTTTSTIWREGGKNNILQIVVSNPFDERFTACQPFGWKLDTAATTTSEAFFFSPAVCPSGWKAYDLVQSLNTKGEPTNKGYCCASGYEFDKIFQGPSISLSGVNDPACRKNIAPTMTIPPGSPSPGTLQTPRSAVQVHIAYTIGWREADVKTLSPSPLDLSCRRVIAFWDPASTDYPKCERQITEADAAPGRTAEFVGVFIILPTGIGLLIVAALVTCCYYSGKEQGEKERKRRAELNAAGNELGVRVPDRRPVVEPGAQAPSYSWGNRQ
ncbi:hypothetical protein OQA88_9152 [Cercophora sp. LCS_1]